MEVAMTGANAPFERDQQQSRAFPPDRQSGNDEPRRLSRRPPRATAQRHGLTRLRAAVRGLGGRVVDKRTTLGRALADWRQELIDDLGGTNAVSTQERAIVDLAVKTKLLLDSIDAWLLTQPSLINKRTRALLPVVRERQHLADALSRYLQALGLERRARPAKSLEEVLNEIAEEKKKASEPTALAKSQDGNETTEGPR